MIKDFKNFINESITLTASDKDFLWKKLEYNKKKKAIDGTPIHDILRSEGSSDISEDEFSNILDSLENGFKHKLEEKEDIKGDGSNAFKSIKSKLPKSWSPTKKLSSISARKKRIG